MQTLLNLVSVGLLSLVALTTQLAAQVQLPSVLSSQMVLQRDMPVPIWGTAAPGEKVTVTFRDQEKSATADAQGKWLVKLDPLKAGGVAGYAKGDEVLARLATDSYPKLRLKRSGKEGWLEGTPKNIAGFSAILFAFGARLHQELDVPVGLMVGAVNGTPSGFWLSQEAYDSDAACKELVEKLGTGQFEQAQKNYTQALAAWEKAVEAAKKRGDKRLPGKPAPPQKPGECAGPPSFDNPFGWDQAGAKPPRRVAETRWTSAGDGE